MVSMEQLIALYEHEYPYFRAIAYNVLSNRQDADDVMQRVMIKLLEKPDILQKVERPKPFLSKCVRNEAVSLLRKNRSSPIPMGNDLLDHSSYIYYEEEFDRTLNYMSIKIYIKKLPPEIQEAFISHVLDGYTIKELAHALGMNPSTLNTQFQRIKIKLNKLQGVLIIMIFL